MHIILFILFNLECILFIPDNYRDQKYNSKHILHCNIKLDQYNSQSFSSVI